MCIRDRSIISAVALAGLVTFFALRKKYEPLQTVDYVDLNRYQGTWYEIARMPFFPENDAYCVTAQYSLTNNGQVQVINTKRQGSKVGPQSSSIGKAWPTDATNSKLKVQFQWPFSGDYYIVDLDKDYQWAIIGAPSRRLGWILARKPQISPSLLEKLVSKMEDVNYDVSELILSEQCI
eukprot:TRINITY_DN649_c0_g2_i1.p1 TRINITY_DN649_c0_g2~~TRINITY_DN649_c0_g2_i1.p1  ORF type:complete len:179 (+),score=25.37 TRINITY_DN649_c0_g2_i1:65-601(+)